MCGRLYKRIRTAVNQTGIQAFPFKGCYELATKSQGTRKEIYDLHKVFHFSVTIRLI